MKEDKDKKKSHAAGYAIFLLVALIIILALLAGVFVTSSVVESSHEHTWDDGVETVSATCEDMGTMTYTCTGCGDKREEAVKPLGHDWESEYTAATCVGVGYVTQVCARCEASQTIPGAQATGVHTMGDEYERVEPTCVETGELRYTCIICGQEIAEELPATGEHVWDGGEVTTEPTCEEAGVMTYTCTLCNEETKTESIAALGHDWENEYCDATCVSAGYVLQTCSKCGETQTITGAQATGVHIMGDVVERTEPTCVKAGELSYTCTICGQVITEEIPATGEHKWNEGEETKAATCTEEGETTYTCTVCSEETTEPIAALGHDLETTHTDATCTTAGKTVITCKRDNCNYTETTPGENPTGVHKRGDDAAYTTVPDCETMGQISYTCEVCGQTITENVPALGHDYVVPDSSNPEFSWDIDKYDVVSASLIVTCTRCGGMSGVEAEVTENGDGSGTYTAIVTYSGIEYKDESGDPFADYNETCSSGFESALTEGGKIKLTESISTSSLDLVDGTEIYLDDNTLTASQVKINGDVTIRGGKIEGGTNSQVVYVTSNAEAELLSCEITGETQVVYVASKGEAELVNCKVTAESSGSGNIIAVQVASGEVTLENCEISSTGSGSSSQSTALYMSAATATLKNSSITSKTAYSIDSMGVFTSENSTVLNFDNCSIYAESGGGAAYGVYLSRGSHTYTDCTLVGESTGSGAAYGFYMYNDNVGNITVTRSVTISGGTFTGTSVSGSSYGIADKGNYGTKGSAYTMTVSGATITGGSYAVYVRETNSTRSFTDCTYNGNTSGV